MTTKDQKIRVIVLVVISILCVSLLACHVMSGTSDLHADIESAAGREPGSYSAWLNGLPFGFGIGIDAADSVWEWQAQFTGFRPHITTAKIRKAYDEGNLSSVLPLSFRRKQC